MKKLLEISDMLPLQTRHTAPKKKGGGSFYSGTTLETFATEAAGKVVCCVHIGTDEGTCLYRPTDPEHVHM